MGKRKKHSLLKHKVEEGKKDNKTKSDKLSANLLKISQEDKKIGAFFTKRASGQIIIAILLALLIPSFTNLLNNIKQRSIFDSTINELCIGLNEDYINERLGIPTYEGTLKVAPIYKCVYISKKVIAQVYYEEKGVCAYFVTLRNQKFDKFGKNKWINNYTKGRPLGRYKFSEVDEWYGGGFRIYWFEGPDTFQYTYLEEYHSYYAKPDYAIFLYLDTGFRNVSYILNDNCFWPEDFDEYPDIPEIYKVNADKYSWGSILDRDNSYPNTFGVISGSYNEEIIRDIVNSSLDWDFGNYVDGLYGN